MHHTKHTNNISIVSGGGGAGGRPRFSCHRGDQNVYLFGYIFYTSKNIVSIIIYFIVLIVIFLWPLKCYRYVYILLLCIVIITQFK